MSVSEEQLFINNLQTLIATSASFRTWTGTASVLLAKDRIYTSRLEEADITKPFAQIGHDSGFTKKDYDKPSQAQMYIIFVGDTVDGIDSETSLNTFMTSTGKVIDDMREQSLVNGYLRMESIGLATEFSYSGDNQFEDEELNVVYSVLTGI